MPLPEADLSTPERCFEALTGIANAMLRGDCDPAAAHRSLDAVRTAITGHAKLIAAANRASVPPRTPTTPPSGGGETPAEAIAERPATYEDRIRAARKASA